MKVICNIGRTVLQFDVYKNTYRMEPNQSINLSDDEYNAIEPYLSLIERMGFISVEKLLTH